MTKLQASILTLLICSSCPLHDAARAQDPQVRKVPVITRSAGASLQITRKQSASDWALGTPDRPDFFFAKAFAAAQESGPAGLWHRMDYERVRPDGRVYPAGEQEFVESFCPGVPVFVVVHGSFIPTTEYEQFYEMYHWIRSAAPERPLHVVFYRWPSDPGLRILLVQPTISRLEHRSDLHGFYLAHMLSRIPANQPVCIFAHSHGTRCASNALHLLGGGRYHGIRLAPEIASRRSNYRIIYSAAAMEHHWLNPGQRYECAVNATNYLLNLRTRNDGILWLFPLRRPFSRLSLGTTGFTARDRAMLGPCRHEIGELDVTYQVGVGHSWSAYFPHHEIAQAIAPTVYFLDQGPSEMLQIQFRQPAEQGGVNSAVKGRLHRPSTPFPRPRSVQSLRPARTSS